MPATIVDIKERTGLSLATISKYLNGGNVLPENKEKIPPAVRLSSCSTGGDYIISDHADCSYGFKYKETENSRKNYTNWNNRRNSISIYDYYLDQFS